jgi:hypothetical protein
MQVKAGTPEGDRMLVVDPSTGRTHPWATAVDTDAGWMDTYFEDPQRPDHALMTDWEPSPEGGVRRQLISARIHVDFDLVDRDTGVVLAEVRQPLLCDYRRDPFWFQYQQMRMQWMQAEAAKKLKE